MDVAIRSEDSGVDRRATAPGLAGVGAAEDLAMVLRFRLSALVGEVEGSKNQTDRIAVSGAETNMPSFLKAGRKLQDGQSLEDAVGSLCRVQAMPDVWSCSTPLALVSQESR